MGIADLSAGTIPTDLNTIIRAIASTAVIGSITTGSITIDANR